MVDCRTSLARSASRLLAATVFLIGSTAAESNASVNLYSNDFQSSVGHEWSTLLTDTTPGTASHPADKFLGQFGNDTVSLSLSGIPDHDQVTVSFDLYLIRTWDGNETREDWGPDHWTLSVAGGPVILDTTFSNDHPNSRYYGQAYPNNWIDGMTPNAPRTGAAEINTLGYTYMYGSEPGGPMDSVYTLHYTIPHSSSSLSLVFSASNLQSLVDESWGLDNVTVSYSPSDAVPEPCTLAIWSLFGAAGMTTGWLRRRKTA
jgi:hypothetical protein